MRPDLPSFVRVGRDWIDVRHEFLQANGSWMAGMCDKPGFCSQCNVDGERAPHQAMRHAFSGRLTDERNAQIVIASHLHIHADEVLPDVPLVATAFRRMSIAYHLTILAGEHIDDEAVLNARTLGDLMCLIVEQPEAASHEA